MCRNCTDETKKSCLQTLNAASIFNSVTSIGTDKSLGLPITLEESEAQQAQLSNAKNTLGELATHCIYTIEQIAKLEY